MYVECDGCIIVYNLLKKTRRAFTSASTEGSSEVLCQKKIKGAIYLMEYGSYPDLLLLVCIYASV